MRNYGPVSNAEYVLPAGEVIITHTDPDSRITYANPAFLTSSEFSLDECLGQPQNIVRHPDMPREAFADLWSTIRSGKSWTGIVKNRRKSGGFYWVRANVTPMMDPSGRIVGYMSVRVKPTSEEIETASRVYADINAGRAGSRQIRHGKVMITVDYPPGAVDPVHRHDAHAVVYVLEGSIVMGVKGGREVTLQPGETFYEGPNDLHTVGRNASQTEPAKFVVLLLKKRGAEILTPVSE